MRTKFPIKISCVYCCGHLGFLFEATVLPDTEMTLFTCDVSTVYVLVIYNNFNNF